MNISVCMATYNGEKYIKEQLTSILEQLDETDEVIIVDDASKDQTIQIIHQFEDNRIKCTKNSNNIGHVATFAKALSLSSNEYIFLSDQDDIWITGRVALMQETLAQSKTMVLSSNFNLLYPDGRMQDSDEPIYSKNSTTYVQNLARIFRGKSGYYGCSMVLHRSLLNYILPIPSYVEAHDFWIIFAANLLKSNMHIDQVTFTRRIHPNNLSRIITRRSLFKKIKARFFFVRSLIELHNRIQTG